MTNGLADGWLVAGTPGGRPPHYLYLFLWLTNSQSGGRCKIGHGGANMGANRLYDMSINSLGDSESIDIVYFPVVLKSAEKNATQKTGLKSQNRVYRRFSKPILRSQKWPKGDKKYIARTA